MLSYPPYPLEAFTFKFKILSFLVQDDVGGVGN